LPFGKHQGAEVDLLVSLLIFVLVLGLILWLIEAFLPLDAQIKRALQVIVIILAVILMLTGFGGFESLNFD
jgi:hypothetical protein